MALARKQKRRLPRHWSKDPGDLRDYYAMDLSKRGRRQAVGKAVSVTDDWPDRVPVTDAELRVIEAFLAKELDDLFGPLP